jgi:hypothetical protein
MFFRSGSILPEKPHGTVGETLGDHVRRLWRTSRQSSITTSSEHLRRLGKQSDHGRGPSTMDPEPAAKSIRSWRPTPGESMKLPMDDVIQKWIPLRAINPFQRPADNRQLCEHPLAFEGVG